MENTYFKEISYLFWYSILPMNYFYFIDIFIYFHSRCAYYISSFLAQESFIDIFSPFPHIIDVAGFCLSSRIYIDIYIPLFRAYLRFSPQMVIKLLHTTYDYGLIFSA